MNKKPTQLDAHKKETQVVLDRKKYVHAKKMDIESGKLKDGSKFDIPTPLLNIENNVRTVEKDEAYTALKTSINDDGLLSPLIVTFEEDEFILVAGHRRLSALAELGIAKVPVIFKSDYSKQAKLQFVENVLREDLTPVQYCNALTKFKAEQIKMSSEALGKIVGKDRKIIERCIKIANWKTEYQVKASSLKLTLAALVNVAKKKDCNIPLELESESKRQLKDGRKKENKDVKHGGPSFDLKLEEKMNGFFETNKLNKTQIRRFSSLTKTLAKFSVDEIKLFNKYCDGVIIPHPKEK